MRFSTGVLVCLAALALSASGCRRDGAPAAAVAAPGPVESEVYVVRPATAAAAAFPDAGGEVRQVRVTVDDDTAAPASGAAETVAGQLVGRVVRVQFRGDALGVSVPGPMTPGGNNFPGRQVDLAGRVEAVDGQWIVLAVADRTYWVPLSSVLLVRPE